MSLVAMSSKSDWPKKITPLQTASHGMKTYSESRIELRTPQILKKMLEKSSQVLLSEQPCKTKSLDAAFNIAGVDK